MQRLIFHHSVKNESELCFTNTFMFLIAKDNSLSFLQVMQVEKANIKSGKTR